MDKALVVIDMQLVMQQRIDGGREHVNPDAPARIAALMGDPRLRPVALLLTDEGGHHVGGLWGKCAFDWLFVELLAVPEEHRGRNHGRALMAQAEAMARASDCIGVWLDTYEFQARGFYEKLGYELFGTLDDHPIGQKRFFLRKYL